MSGPSYTGYAYDAAGRPVMQSALTTTIPVTRVLDNQGRLIAQGESIAGTSAYTGTFGYDPTDQPITSSLPNAVATGTGYDAKGRLITATLAGPAGVGTPLTNSYGYAYNPADWTTALTTAVSGIATTQLITHDVQGRLLAVTDSAGNAQSWSYDGNGNLLTGVLNGQTTLYSDTQSITPNELLTQTVLAGTPITSVFGYDQNGDTTLITSTLNTTTTLVYDSAARPITLTASTPTTATSVFLRSNAAGQRSAYSLYRGTTFSYGAQFTYRGAELGQAVVFSGTTSYTDTDLYDGQGAPLELIRQTKVGGTLSTARYWYVLDGRGDVVALTDSSGSVVDRYAYGVWGSLVSASESVPQRLRYAGYWYDQELNWYWVGVRYYSPSIKRWLQPDPSMQDGVRTYVYVGDDPTDRTDPSGLVGCFGQHGLVIAGFQILPPCPTSTTHHSNAGHSSGRPQRRIVGATSTGFALDRIWSWDEGDGSQAFMGPRHADDGYAREFGPHYNLRILPKGGASNEIRNWHIRLVSRQTLGSGDTVFTWEARDTKTGRIINVSGVAQTQAEAASQARYRLANEIANDSRLGASGISQADSQALESALTQETTVQLETESEHASGGILDFIMGLLDTKDDEGGA